MTSPSTQPNKPKWPEVVSAICAVINVFINLGINIALKLDPLSIFFFTIGLLFFLIPLVKINLRNPFQNFIDQYWYLFIGFGILSTVLAGIIFFSTTSVTISKPNNLEIKGNKIQVAGRVFRAFRDKDKTFWLGVQVLGNDPNHYLRKIFIDDNQEWEVSDVQLGWQQNLDAKFTISVYYADDLKSINGFVGDLWTKGTPILPNEIQHLRSITVHRKQ
jgi:hypothetical protein